jgi:predicted ArsR family transcriptional regulator
MMSTAERDRLLAALDGEWRTAKELADMSGTGRRQAGQRLVSLVRAGVAEGRRVGARPRGRRDGPPMHYRRCADWRAP